MRFRVDQYLSLLLLTLLILISGLRSRALAGEDLDSITFLNKPMLTLPFIDEQSLVPQLSASAVIVIDEKSAVTLYEKNAAVKLSPASTTKLMTALVARSLFGLDATLSTPSLVNAIDGTKMGLQVGEKVSVHNLLKGALIQSGNDAAITLASAHPAGVEGFVAAMNDQAKALHLSQTVFMNPIGYDAVGHFSSPRDLALLAREVMRDPVLRRIVGTADDVVTDTTGSISHTLHTTHKLLGIDPNVVGIKTGTTDEAGEVLITQFNRNDQSILVVVMGSKDRYSDTRALMEYVTQAVEWRTLE